MKFILSAAVGFILTVLMIRTEAQPSAGFELSRHKVCSGGAVDFINTSVDANSFEWYIDGQFYSSALDTTAIFHESCYDVIFIRLVSCDTLSGICDTANSAIEVFDSCFFHWTADIISCPGDTINLSAHPEATRVMWNLQPSTLYLNGCDTCRAISFILTQNGTMVDVTNTYAGDCIDITSYHYLCLSQSVDEIINSVSVYPNPFKNGIKIHLLNDKAVEELFIVNSMGQVVYKDDLFSDGINLESLSEGVYYMVIHFKFEAASRMKAFVIEKVK